MSTVLPDKSSNRFSLSEGQTLSRKREAEATEDSFTHRGTWSSMFMGTHCLWPGTPGSGEMALNSSPVSCVFEAVQKEVKKKILEAHLFSEALGLQMPLPLFEKSYRKL